MFFVGTSTRANRGLAFVLNDVRSAAFEISDLEAGAPVCPAGRSTTWRTESGGRVSENGIGFVWYGVCAQEDRL
jgi:hypothetical protein